MQGEIWKDIVGTDGEYQASSIGRIRSADLVRECKSRWGTNIKINKKGRILKKQASNSGYEYVTIRPKGKDHNAFVHTLVLSAFKCIDFRSKYKVNHINGVRVDNRIENLEACTNRENVMHARNVLKKRGKYLTITDVVEIIKMSASGQKTKDIAKKYSLCRHSVSRILNGSMWPSKDYPLIKDARDNFKPKIRHTKWIVA